jgi:hypothetical protein
MLVVPVRDLIDGVSYTVKVVAYDLAGLKSVISFVFKINRTLADKTPPEISFLSPDSEGMLTGDRRVELTVEVRDLESGFELSVSPISVELSGPDGEVAIQDLMVDSSDINSALLTTYPSVDLQLGQYTLLVKVTDRNNNSQSNQRSFAVIGPPPAFGDQGTSLNRLQTEGTKKFLSVSPATISEQLDISQLPGGGSVEIYLNGDLKTTAKIDADSGSFLANEVDLHATTTRQLADIQLFTNRCR